MAVNIVSKEYVFSMHKQTQHMESVLWIDQCPQGLQIFLQDSGNVHQVPRHLIEGLPKEDLVPKEFFDSCHARVAKLGSESKIYFVLSLNGGMYSDELSAFRKTLMENLGNDYEEDLTEEDKNLILDSFSRIFIAEKEQQGQGEIKIKEEIEKMIQSDRERLIDPFMYVINRAKGKYLFGIDDAIIIALISAAASIISAYFRNRGNKNKSNK